MSASDPRPYGWCLHVLYPETRINPEERCGEDTHPDHDRCPRHGGPDPDDHDYDLDLEEAA